MRSEMSDLLSFKFNFSALRFEQSDDGFQHGGFAGSIGANQADNFTGVYREGNIFQCANIAIVGGDVIDFQQRLTIFFIVLSQQLNKLSHLYTRYFVQHMGDVLHAFITIHTLHRHFNGFNLAHGHPSLTKIG